MRKNKIFKRVLAFASTFIVLVSLCATIAFAQAPNVEISQSTDYDRLFATVYDEQTTDVVMLFYSNINKSTFSTDTYCVLTENYYSNYFGGDLYDITVSRFEIVISTYYGATTGGPAQYYLDTLLNAFNDFYDVNLTSDGSFVSPFTDQDIITAIEISEQSQFYYWGSEIQNAKDVAFDNGFSEGKQTGLQVGYNNGLTDGYTNALNDFDMFERGLFDIFNAPFIFVRNIVGFEIFGITISDVIIGVLLLCLGFVLIKFIGGAIPL